MKLEKLKLHNYCQFRDTTVTFEKGLAVLIGKNGAGKSNLLNAVFYSLTGESSIEDKTRPKMLKWGEKKGYIELTFKLTGVVYVIKRNLQGATAKMTWEEGTEVISLNKAVEINIKIMELLNINANTLLLSSFMPQKGSTKLIFGTNVERMKEYSRLFRLLHLEKIREMLQKKYNEVETFQDFTEEIEKLTDEMKYASLEHNKNTDNLKKQEDLLGDLKKKYQVSIKRAHAMSKEEWETKDKKLQKELKVLCREKTVKQNLLKNLGEPVIITEEDMLKSSKYLQTKEKGKLVLELEEQKNTIVIPEEPIQVPQENIDSATQVLLKYEAKLQAYYDHKCPTCDQEFIISVKRDFEQLETDLDKAKSFLHHLKKEDRKAKEEAQAYVQITQEHKQLSIEYNRAVEEFTQLSTMVENFDYKAYQKKVKQAELTLTTQEERKALEARLNQIDPTADGLSKERGVLKEAGYYEEGGQDDKFIANFEELRDIMIPESKKILAAQDKEIEMIKQQLTEKQKYMKLGKTCAVYREFLQNVRGVLHVDNFPKKLVAVYSSHLTELVSKYLSVFRQPFCITINADLAVICSFPDNPEVNVSDLSGGQQMILIVAFRLAISEMTVNNVSFISMDEPTNHLDADSRDYLTETFGKVKEYLKLSDIQMIVSTHEPKIQSVADYIIKV